MVAGLEGKIPSHHFADWPEAIKACSDGDSDETMLADGGVEHSLGAVFLEEAAGTLVGAAVKSNVFADQENLGVAGHLFVHGSTNSVTDRYLLK